MYTPPPNAFYYIALFVIWPFFAYKIYKRFDLEKSVILLFLVPYLFLPVPHAVLTPIKLPLLPALDKEAVPVFVALILLYINKVKIDYLPRFRISLFFCLALLFSPFLTVFTPKMHFSGLPLYRLHLLACPSNHRACSRHAT